MTTLLNDLRYALRQLRKAPGFTVTSVVTLALGIGISAAMFTVIDGVLLRPLPVPHPNRIVALGEATPNGFGTSSLPNLRDWRAQAKSFQGIAWFTQLFFNLKRPDGSVDFSLDAQSSVNFFSMLQAKPLLGRTFLPQDRRDGSNVVVISYYVWNHYLGRDPHILGKTLSVGTGVYTVIGVMPRYFYIPINDDGPLVWTLLVPNASMTRENQFLSAIGRLKPGVHVAAARAELTGIQANIVRQYAALDLPPRVGVMDYRESQIGTVRSALLALQGAVLLVWLIACANVAGLLLTRLSARRREIAVRAALGASRRRITRQFLTESLLIGISSGILGYAVAVICLRLLSHSIHANLTRSADIELNWHLIVVLIGLSIFSAVLFGTVPALHAASADPQEALHQGTLAAGSGLGRVRLRKLLIVGELALSLVLLFSAGLVLRTLYALREVHLGFNQNNLIDAQFFPLGGFTITDKKRPVIQTVYDPLLARARRLPGVESASLVSRAPLSPNINMSAGFTVLGSGGKRHQTEFAFAAPGVFRTLEIPLLQGRPFTPQDSTETQAVGVVNQAFVRTYLAGKNPLEQRLSFDTDHSAKSIFSDLRIVGVVGDSAAGKVGEPAVPMVYTDLTQLKPEDDYYPIASIAMELIVRTHQEPQTLIPAIRSAFAQVAPGVSIASVRTYREKIDGELGSQTLAARLLWIFAIAAVLISAAGLYGLLSYSVAQRTREIGVRIALGAQRKDILRVVLRQAARLLTTGVAIGLVCALLLGRLLRSFLYGVSHHDGITLIAVAVLLSLVGLVAAYIPAHRASRVEPTEALRTE